MNDLHGKEVLFVNFSVPPSVLLLLDVMRTRGKFGHDCEVPVCHFDQIVKTAEHLGLDHRCEYIRNLLRLLNGLGAIMWFPNLNNDLIILNPQWLLNAMACIIREHTGHHGKLLQDLLQDKHALPLFEKADIERGFLSVELLEYIWQSSDQKYNALKATPDETKALKAILEHFGLICRVRVPHKHFSTEYRECYGVPALMETLSPDKRDDIDDLAGFYGGHKCTCRLDFGVSKWLPSFMFERLLCNVMASEDVGCIQMSKNEVVFHIDKLVILLRQRAVTWFIEAQTVTHKGCPHASQRMLTLVESAMEKVMHSFNVSGNGLYRVLVETVVETENDWVELSELRKSLRECTEQVFTSDRLRWLTRESTKALKDKWLEGENILSSSKIHSPRRVAPRLISTAALELRKVIT